MAVSSGQMDPNPAAGDRSRPGAPPRRSSARAAGSSSTGRAARDRTRLVAPILARGLRDGFEERAHRGDIVEVDLAGRVIRAIGDPDRPVFLGPVAHPFGVAALIDAGGLEAFQLEPQEIALMAGSHSGEDLHVRTLQGVLRRATLTQALLAIRAEGMPLDQLTAARLARDGERPGPVRHMCSGQHVVAILISKLGGWETMGYWMPEHPAQVAIRAAVAAGLGVRQAELRPVTDSCGLPGWGVPLRTVAGAFAALGQATALPPADPRAGLAPALALVRDAMLAHPDMVGGARDRLDTSLMKELPGRIVSVSALERLRVVAALPDPKARGTRTAGSGVAIRIEDGGADPRAGWSVTVEALAQSGLLDPASLRALGRYHRPTTRDPNGTQDSETVAAFDLVPVGELVP